MVLSTSSKTYHLPKDQFVLFPATPPDFPGPSNSATSLYPATDAYDTVIKHGGWNRPISAHTNH